MIALLKYWKLSAALLCAVFVFGAGWTVNGWRYEAAISRTEKQQLAAQAKADADAAKANADTQVRESAALATLQALQDANAKLQEEISHATLVQRPSHSAAAVGNACPTLGPDFLRLYNAASSESHTASADQASGVPTGAPAATSKPPG